MLCVVPVEELRRMAAAGSPPEENVANESDLVDLHGIDGVHFDVRYATTNNFMGVALYEAPEAWARGSAGSDAAIRPIFPPTNRNAQKKKMPRTKRRPSACSRAVSRVSSWRSRRF